MMSGGSPKVRAYGRQLIDDDDIDAVVAVLRGEFLTTGPAVPDFEAALSTATGAPYAVACSSGTAALHLAALAAGLGTDAAVIVPAITFVATANAPGFTGAEIVLADVDPDTGLMEARHAEAALERATRPVRAIFPVHLNGQFADLQALRGVADTQSAYLIEDACHALGTLYRGAPVGGCDYADMTCFSFHPVKTIASGEGGAVTTKDEAFSRRMTLLRNHGINRDPDEYENREGAGQPWYGEMQTPGLNYRMSDIHAALGASQMRKLTRFRAQRKLLADAYEAALAPLGPVVRPVGRAPDNIPCWHLMAVLIDFVAAGVDRATLMNRLRDRGVGTQVHYVPLPWQPYYRKNSNPDLYTGARAYYESCLSLPYHAGMDAEDVAYVTAILAQELGV